MKREVKRDITKRYRKMVESLSVGNKGKEVCFKCERCGKVIKTRYADEGNIPFGITCSCGSDAMQQEGLYDVPVTHEWYRPSLEETIALADEHLFTVMSILHGGLLRREIT